MTFRERTRMLGVCIVVFMLGYTVAYAIHYWASDGAILLIGVFLGAVLVIAGMIILNRTTI